MHIVYRYINLPSFQFDSIVPQKLYQSCLLHLSWPSPINYEVVPSDIKRKNNGFQIVFHCVRAPCRGSKLSAFVLINRQTSPADCFRGSIRLKWNARVDCGNCQYCPLQSATGWLELRAFYLNGTGSFSNSSARTRIPNANNYSAPNWKRIIAP